LEGQLGLVNSRRKLLGIEEATFLESAAAAIGAFGDVEDDGVGVELRRGIAIDGPGGVMFKLRGYKFAGGLV
jgi:hypothetical protein